MTEPVSDVAFMRTANEKPMQAEKNSAPAAWPVWCAGAVWCAGWVMFLLTQPLRLDASAVSGLAACLIGVPALAILAWRHHRQNRLLFKYSQGLLEHLEQFGRAGDAIGGRAEQLALALEQRTHDYLTAGQALTSLADRILVDMKNERNAFEALGGDLERRGQAMSVALSRQVTEMTHATETANRLAATHASGLEQLVAKVTDHTRLLSETLEQRMAVLNNLKDKGHEQMETLGAHLAIFDRSQQAVSDQIALLGAAETRALDWIERIKANLTEQNTTLAEGARSLQSEAERNQDAMSRAASLLVERLKQIDDATAATLGHLTSAGSALERQAQQISRSGEQATMTLVRFGDSFQEQTVAIGKAVDQAQTHVERLSHHLPVTAKALQEQSQLVRDALSDADRLGEKLQASIETQGDALDRANRQIERQIEESRSMMQAQASDLARLTGQMSETDKQMTLCGHNVHQAMKDLSAQLARSRQDLSETATAVDHAANQSDLAVHRQAEQMIELFNVFSRSARDIAQLSESSREGLSGLNLELSALLHALETGSHSATDRLGAVVGDLEHYASHGESVLAAIVYQQTSLTTSLGAIADRTAHLDERSRQTDSTLERLAKRLQETLDLFLQADRHLTETTQRLDETMRLNVTRLDDGKQAIDRAGASLQAHGERGTETVNELNERWISLHGQAEEGRQALERWGQVVGDLAGHIDRALTRIDEAGDRLGVQQERIDGHLQATTVNLTNAAFALDRQATALALLCDRVGERAKQASDTLEERIARLDDASSQIETHFTALSESISPQLDRFIQASAALQTESDDTSQSLIRMRDETADLLARIAAISEALGEMRGVFATSNADLEGMPATVAARLEEVSTHLAGRMEQVTEIAHLSVDSLSKSIATLRHESERAHESGKTFIGRLEEMLAKLAERFVPLQQAGDRALARIEEQSNNLSAQGAQIRLDLNALANDLLSITSQLSEQSQAVNALSAAAERAGQAISRVDEVTARLPEHLEALEMAGRTISPALDRLGSELSERMAGLGDLPLQARAVTDEAIARIESLRAKTAELVETARSIREEDLTIPAIGNKRALPVAGEEPNRFLANAAVILSELESLTHDLARPLLKLPDREGGEKRSDRALHARRLAENWTDQLSLETRLRHGEDRAFRRLVDSYIEYFERLFAGQTQSGVPHALDAILLSSDQGRLYIHLARAIGRL